MNMFAKFSSCILLTATMLAFQVSTAQQKTGATAAKKPTTAAAPKPKTTASTAPVKVTSVEGITEYKLANGLRVLLFPDQSKPTITVNITYLVGSRVEGYGETGMAHLLEHMVFKGSKGHTNIPQELTAHGASPNGSTSYDRTNYFETFSATDENLNWALDLESDRMVNSFIAKKDLETEFSVVRNEFESGENNPEAILYERVLSTAYLWHNYGKATIGSKEDIELVPIENLQAFYHKYYQPDDAVLLVAGKIDEAKTLELVNKYFGKIAKPKRTLQEPYTKEPTQDGQRLCELRRVGDVQAASCGYHICNGAHADYAAIDVLTDILINQPSGRLYKALVDTKKATSIFGGSEALKDPGFIYFSANVLKDKSLEDAKTTLLNAFDSLKYATITQEEVDRGKNKILKDFDLSYNNSTSVGLTLSEYIAQGDWRLWFWYRDQVQKVTTDDVTRVIKTYFKPSNRTVGLFIPEAAPDRSDIPNNPDLSNMLKDYKGKAKIADGETFDATPDNIDARTKTGTIPGGAKYAMLKKSTRGGAVHMQITLRIGSAATLGGKATISEFAANMLNLGTATKTRDQINDAFDKLKAEVGTSGEGQTVTIKIKTIKENLSATLKLVNEILRQPSFPQSEFDKMVEEEISGIDQQKSEPQSIAANAFQRISSPYPATDFRYKMTFDEQKAAVKAVKLEDVKKFYTDYYGSSNATIGVIGDFDEATVVNELTTMLQNWNAPVKYERTPDTYFDVAAKTEKVNTPDKSNATLMAGYNLELRDDDPDYPALMMGNFMLGGGFLNSRLAVRIRQKEGISYGVGSWLIADPQDKSGGFGTYAIYNPDNLEKLLVAYKEELAKVLDKGFTETELKDARSGLLQQRKVGRTNDDGLTNRLAENLFIGRNMQGSKKIDEAISALTVEQINAAMRKWLKPEKISYVMAGDFERKKK